MPVNISENLPLKVFKWYEAEYLTKINASGEAFGYISTTKNLTKIPEDQRIVYFRGGHVEWTPIQIQMITTPGHF